MILMYVLVSHDRQQGSSTVSLLPGERRSRVPFTHEICVSEAYCFGNCITTMFPLQFFMITHNYVVWCTYELELSGI